MNIYQLALILLTTMKLGKQIWGHIKKNEDSEDKNKHGKFLGDLVISVGLYFMFLWLSYKAGVLIWE